MLPYGKNVPTKFSTMNLLYVNVVKIQLGMEDGFLNLLMFQACYPYVSRIHKCSNHELLHVKIDNTKLAINKPVLSNVANG